MSRRTFGPFVLAASLLAACVEGAHDGSVGQATDETNGLRLAEKDLAVAFLLDDSSAPTASTQLGDAPLFSRERYARVAAAFRGSNADGAFEGESIYEDWKLVSLRVVPCSALVLSPSAGPGELCWPEVRLVLQPVLHDVRIHERTSEAYADDRAIHALYDVPPETVMPAAEAARTKQLVQRVREAARGWRGGPFAPLTDAERDELRAARVSVVRDLLGGARGLRDASEPGQAYSGHGVRPESASGGPRASAFASRVTSFLARHAPPRALRAVTAFSLPEGREPAHADEWVFVSLRAKEGVLAQDPIKMFSAADGRVLVDLGMTPSAHQISDDVSVHGATRDPAVAEEIRARAMLTAEDIARLTPTVRDRRTTLVPNTTCGSCHKMNALRFDFHNFGYLEDRELTISPRVVTDVELDLAWIRDNLEAR